MDPAWLGLHFLMHLHCYTFFLVIHQTWSTVIKKKKMAGCVCFWKYLATYVQGLKMHELPLTFSMTWLQCWLWAEVELITTMINKINSVNSRQTHKCLCLSLVKLTSCCNHNDNIRERSKAHYQSYSHNRSQSWLCQSAALSKNLIEELQKVR